MTLSTGRPPSPLSGLRIATLIIIWLVVVFLVAPPLGLYYELLAAWCVVPPLGLIYVYCLSHRRRATAWLAVVATVVAALIIGFAVVFPKGSAA